MFKGVLKFGFFVFALFSINGCLAFRTTNIVPRAQDKIIEGLEGEVKQLNQELYNAQRKKEIEIQRLKSIQQQLRQKLQKEIEKNEASVTMSDRGLVIQFLSQVFFSSGQANLTKAGNASLEKISQTLLKLNRQLRIEGHTDNEPIKRTKFLYASNWELSAVRSLTVLEFLMAKGINPKLLSLAAYGEHHPVVSNATLKGRKKNRRVEIIVIPNYTKKDSQALHPKTRAAKKSYIK